jgi:hypothetical protein
MTNLLTRRSLLGGLGCACCAGLVGTAQARISPHSMAPLIKAGYRPTETDEKGLWAQYERVEQEIAGSNLLIQDKALTSYLGDLTGRVGGPAAKDLRIYLAQIPEFNAFMAPTGFMVVFSGLLTRMRDEAQLSGVIAHEAGHFLRRHHIRGWRDLRNKSDILSIAAMGAGVAGGASGIYMGDAVQLAQMGTILSLFAYSRQLEAEADAMGLKLISEAGYDPVAMPNTWQQLIEETEASARMRKKRPQRGYSLFATHPAPASRMADLRASAQEVKGGTGEAARGRERYLKAIGKYRQRLLDDQVKLNDPGASLYIVENLAKDGWTWPPSLLRSRDLATEGREGRWRARRLGLCRGGRASRRPGRSMAQPRLCRNQGGPPRDRQGGARPLSRHGAQSERCGDGPLFARAIGGRA